MTDKDLEWKEVSTEHVIQDEWVDFRRSVYRYPDGRVLSPFYSYSRRNFVVIIASDKAGRYICVRQFRQGIKTVIIEFPAGGIESGDSPESAQEAAKRELKEETGYVSDEWHHLLTIPENAAFSDNYASIFIARNCWKSSEPCLDENELLSVAKYTAEEIDSMIHTGRFQEVVHMMAWLYLKETKRLSDY